VLPGGGYADVLGDLVAWADGRLVVRIRSGDQVTVEEATVVAGKRVPPPPARRAPRSPSVAELEEAAALGWQAVEAVWLGRWLLRASGGFTGRANSVLPLDDPDLPVPAAIDYVESWYAARGLPARFQVPAPEESELDGLLADRRWTAYNRTHVMTADLVQVVDAVPLHSDLPLVEVGTELTEEWFATYHYRGGSQPPPVARQLFLSARAQAFATVRDDDGVIAIGRVAVDAGWAGITALEVAERARRRGLAQQVTAALSHWALDAGVDRCYLQVAGENAPALAMYERLGFRQHHDYHYRLAPG
jgi:GNAT superfamily N-acetyltransferase